MDIVQMINAKRGQPVRKSRAIRKADKVYFDTYSFIGLYFDNRDELSQRFYNYEIFDEVADKMEREAWDDCCEDIQNALGSSTGFVVTASLGLWNGRSRGGKLFKHSSIDSVISATIGDCEYIEIVADDGDLVFVGHHHDGSNYFRVRAISDRAYNWLESEYDEYMHTEEDMVEKVFELSDKADLGQMYVHGFQDFNGDVVEELIMYAEDCCYDLEPIGDEPQPGDTIVRKSRKFRKNNCYFDSDDYDSLYMNCKSDMDYQILNEAYNNDWDGCIRDMESAIGDWKVVMYNETTKEDAVFSDVRHCLESLGGDSWDRWYVVEDDGDLLIHIEFHNGRRWNVYLRGLSDKADELCKELDEDFPWLNEFYPIDTGRDIFDLCECANLSKIGHYTPDSIES